MSQPPLDKTVTIRMPADVHEAMSKLAERERRSLNGQIVYVLELALDNWDALIRLALTRPDVQIPQQRKEEEASEDIRLPGLAPALGCAC